MVNTEGRTDTIVLVCKETPDSGERTSQGDRRVLECARRGWPGHVFVEDAVAFVATLLYTISDKAP